MKSYRKIAFLCVIASILSIDTIKAQNIIRGIVKNSNGKPLLGVNIIIEDPKDELVVAFGFTNKEGRFELSITDSISKFKTLIITVGLMGYITQSFPLKIPILSIEVTLQPQTSTLPEVTVKNSKPNVRFKSDTLSFSVASFEERGDRVISDIIRKLPGVEVDQNGKITYQGKSITHLYIDGDDILDGRYNVATRTLPVDLVDKIQILENHQAIKAFRDIIPNNQPAMNIHLKDNARVKLISEGNLSVGDPKLLESNFNNMLFKKRVKFINYFKSNNTGFDLNDDLISHTNGYNQNNAVVESFSERNILSLRTAGTPDIFKPRYLFNKSYLLNINTLFKLDDETGLKLNAFYIRQQVTQNYYYQSEFLLPLDTIRYIETQYWQSNEPAVQMNLNYHANKKKYLLTNTTSWKTSQKDLVSNLNSQLSDSIRQAHQYQLSILSNSFSYIRLFKKNTSLEVFSNINFSKHPEQLLIRPGFNEHFFDEKKILELNQNFKQPTFQINKQLKIRKPVNDFAFSIKTSWDFQKSTIQSSLRFLDSNNNIKFANDSFQNNLDWQRSITNFEIISEMNTSKWNIHLTIPFTSQITIYGDQKFARKEIKNHFTSLNPTFKIDYKLNSYHQLNFFFTRAFSQGGISEGYQGFILMNYRTLNRNIAPLSEYYSNSLTFNHAYRNPVKLLFINSGISLIDYRGNAQSSSYLDEQILISQRTLFDYSIKMKNAYSSISKYLFNLKTTISAKVIWQKNNQIQLINSSLVNFNNFTTTYSWTIHSKVKKWASLDYRGSYSHIMNKSVERSSNINPEVVKLLRHQFEFNLTPYSDFITKLKLENYHNKGFDKNVFSSTFIDIVLLKKIPKHRINMECVISNLANQLSYSIIQTQNNNTTLSYFPLRPRMFLIKLNFFL